MDSHSILVASLCPPSLSTSSFISSFVRDIASQRSCFVVIPPLNLPLARILTPSRYAQLTARNFHKGDSGLLSLSLWLKSGFTRCWKWSLEQQSWTRFCADQSLCCWCTRLFSVQHYWRYQISCIDCIVDLISITAWNILIPIQSFALLVISE